MNVFITKAMTKQRMIWIGVPVVVVGLIVLFGVRVRHEAEPEPQELERGRLAGAPAADQAIQAIGELELDAAQEPSGDAEPEEGVMG